MSIVAYFVDCDCDSTWDFVAAADAVADDGDFSCSCFGYLTIAFERAD